MQIDLTGHHVDITPSLRDYVAGKMERVARHFERVGNVHVILGVEKLRHRAEATINIAGAQVFADAEAEDMYAAIDALVDKLDRQVKKQKEKNTDYRSSGAVKPGIEE